MPNWRRISLHNDSLISEWRGMGAIFPFAG
jgi:hypothetical protein